MSVDLAKWKPLGTKARVSLVGYGADTDGGGWQEV